MAFECIQYFSLLANSSMEYNLLHHLSSLVTFFAEEERGTLREGLKKEKEKNYWKIPIRRLPQPPPPPTLLGGKKTKNDLRATKRILCDVGDYLATNRPSYGVSLFYF